MDTSDTLTCECRMYRHTSLCFVMHMKYNNVFYCACNHPKDTVKLSNARTCQINGEPDVRMCIVWAPLSIREK
ncbi:hypothetical protein AG1IA_03376 [Rhizoctonia solani AG-1 IA]|uniref:Uncharacterized protein n=1 Tax=Thanatephorus cucumeris (strain AG1-IA) TaxID=983506 RepID=L8WWW9_THACA|nr:hypothetical protein AG1IA_03376 [Rhizoctonia solani AG-1 IA]